MVRYSDETVGFSCAIFASAVLRRRASGLASSSFNSSSVTLRGGRDQCAPLGSPQELIEFKLNRLGISI